MLITGANGFVGKALVQSALDRGIATRASSRYMTAGSDRRAEYCQTGEIGPATDWSAALQGVDVLVHCAGRAHVMREAAADPLVAFRSVNTEGTLHLARQAIAAGVKRFVFISSIGVNGVSTKAGKAFAESDRPSPHNGYALSKWEAEQGLRALADQCGMDVVVIRPPLVYGLGAPGNFGALRRAVQRGLPLPLGAIHNKRSLVGLENLVDFILTCARDGRAAGHTFLVSDGQDLSTTELVRGIAAAANVRVRLLPVPAWALQAGATLIGRGDSIQRLAGNLQVDISKARSVLGWEPPMSVDAGLRNAIFGDEKKIR